MVKRDYKIYHLTFPNGETYVGSTSLSLNRRYGNYRASYKTSQSLICKTSTQYKFKEVSMVEIDKIRCIEKDPQIRILEEKWIKKLNPSLNLRRAYRTSEEKYQQVKYHRKITKDWKLKVFNKEYYNQNREEIIQKTKLKNKSPLGRLNSKINDAKISIEKYTKQNRPDMVLRWEGKLKERIQDRLDYQSQQHILQ